MVPAPASRRSERPDWIQWRHSAARMVLVDDLENGVLALEESAEEAWARYKSHRDFQGTCFEQFQENLETYRTSMKGRRQRSLQQKQALAHDRVICPRKSVNSRGEPVFDMSPAKDLLRSDIKEGRNMGIKPSEFQKTRPEYAAFKPPIFAGRIDQEIRRNKYINHLQAKREMDLTAARKRDEKNEAKKKKKQRQDAEQSSNDV